MAEGAAVSGRGLPRGRYRRLVLMLPRPLAARLEREAARNGRTTNGELAAIIKAHQAEMQNGSDDLDGGGGR